MRGLSGYLSSSSIVFSQPSSLMVSSLPIIEYVNSPRRGHWAWFMYVVVSFLRDAGVGGCRLDHIPGS